MWSSLLLIAFCINGANAVCYKDPPADGTLRKLIETTSGRTEYQCRLECVNNEMCSFYNYQSSSATCTLLREDADTSGMVAHYALKRAHADCQGVYDVPEISISKLYDDFGHNLVLDQQEVKPMVHNESTWNPCPLGSILDITLPNKKHVVYGNGASWVLWDSKLAAWTFVKQTTKLNNIKRNTTTYIMSARCYEVKPEQFADPTLCGGSLPTRDTVTKGYNRIGEMNKYGVFEYCPNPNNKPDTLLQVYTDISVDESETRSTKVTRVACVHGSWILVYGKENTTPTSTQRITHGTCVEYARG